MQEIFNYNSNQLMKKLEKLHSLIFFENIKGTGDLTGYYKQEAPRIALLVSEENLVPKSGGT